MKNENDFRFRSEIFFLGIFRLKIYEVFFYNSIKKYNKGILEEYILLTLPRWIRLFCKVQWVQFEK